MLCPAATVEAPCPKSVPMNIGAVCAPDRLITTAFFREGAQAIGALRYLHEHSICVPEDIEILSYGDTPQDAYILPSLTSIHMPIEEMSRDCLLTLLKMTGNKGEQPTAIIHPFHFAFRES